MRILPGVGRLLICVDCPLLRGRFALSSARSAVAVASHAMSQTPPEHHDFIHSEEFLHRLMQRQLRLSIACALCFGTVLLGLPLVNYLCPDLMASRVGGFTISWLILGVLFFPLVWVISGYFIRRSLQMEREEADSALAENQRRGRVD